MFPFPSRATTTTYYSDLFSNCCGFRRTEAERRRRREFDFIRPMNSYIYSPSTAHLDHFNNNNNNNHYGLNNWMNYIAATQQTTPQPYILVPQPVIIASNPLTGNQLNTMTLVQPATTAGSGLATTTSGALVPLTFNQQQQQQSMALINNLQPAMQNNLLAQQQNPYGIVLGNNQQTTATTTTANMIKAPSINNNAHLMIAGSVNNSNNNTNIPFLITTSLPTNQNIYETNQSLLQANNYQQQQQDDHQITNVPLSSEIFRQLEMIEKQVDLSKDMDLIEKFGIVITRALDPYSLMPHLTETTLRKYNNYFLFNDDYVIRFIEVIKRPGQTLGVYMRLINFETSKLTTSYNLSTTRSITRPGFVISKILTDSPIYNSKVLHVGDEIISINLVDIQGMNIDDVVIMMSIPKRLVLAIRIPRERDQLLSLNLIHQQQQQQARNLNTQFEQQQQQQSNNRMSSITSDNIDNEDLNLSFSLNANHNFNPTSSATNNNYLSGQTMENFSCDLQLQPRPFSNSGITNERNWIQSNVVGHRTLPARPNSIASASNMSTQLHHEQQTSLSPTISSININNNNNNNNKPLGNSSILNNIRLGETPEQSSYFSSSIDAINRELKELRKQRMALSNNENNIVDTTCSSSNRENNC